MVCANFPQKLTRNRSSNDNYKSSFRVLDHYHSFKLTLQNLAATFLNFSPFWNWKSPTFNVISPRSKVYRNADILNRWGDNSGLWEIEQNPGQVWRKKGRGVGRKRSCCWRGVEGKWFVVRCLLHNFAVLQTVFWFSISKEGVQILKTEYEFHLSPS